MKSEFNYMITICFVIAAIFLLNIPVLVTAQDQSPPSGMDKGVWVLKEKKPDFKPAEDEPLYFNNHVSVSGNTVNGGWSWKDDPVKPECSGKVWGTCSWEELPSVIQPGVGQNTTLTADVGGSQSCAYRHVSARTELAINDQNLNEIYARTSYATGDPKPAPVSVKVPWEAPWGKIGDTFTVTVIAQVPGAVSNRFYYNYIYTYEAPGSQPKQYTSTAEPEPVEQQNGPQEFKSALPAPDEISDGTQSLPQDIKDIKEPSLEERIQNSPGLIERIEGKGDVKVDGFAIKPGAVEDKSRKMVRVFYGQTIHTGPGTEVILLFKTGATGIIKENSDFTLKKEEFMKGNEVEIYTSLLKGTLNFYVPKGASEEKKFEVETNLAIVGIKGTIFNITETQESTTLYVVDGTVSVKSKNTGEEALVSAGERIKVTDLGLTKPGRFDPTSEKASWKKLISETEGVNTETDGSKSETYASGKVEGAMSYGQSGYYLLKKGYEYYENGSIDEAKNCWGDANEAFDKAIESDQSNASYWNGKGCALIDIGGIEKQKEAARDFGVATALDPENAIYWDHKGWALSSVGEPDEALKAYDKAIELDPQNAYIYWANKYDALMLVDRRDDAAKAYAQYKATAGGVDIMDIPFSWPMIR